MLKKLSQKDLNFVSGGSIFVDKNWDSNKPSVFWKGKFLLNQETLEGFLKASSKTQIQFILKKHLKLDEKNILNFKDIQESWECPNRKVSVEFFI